MCFGRKKKAPAPAVKNIVASTESNEAVAASRSEELRRRSRAGVANHILTSQLGIPAGRDMTMGGGK